MLLPAELQVLSGRKVSQLDLTALPWTERTGFGWELKVMALIDTIRIEQQTAIPFKIPWQEAERGGIVRVVAIDATCVVLERTQKDGSGLRITQQA